MNGGIPVDKALLALALAMAGFFFDLATPVGAAGGVPYVALVLFGFWMPDARHALVLGCVASALAVAGYLLSPDAAAAWIELSNRGLALAAIWITAVLVYAHRRQTNRPDEERTGEAGSAGDRSDILEAAERELENQMEARERIERALREREARFRDFADVSSDWHWEVDRDLRLTFLSDRFFSVSGVLPDLLIGKPHIEAFGGSLDDTRWQRHAADLDARRPFRDFLCDYRRADDELRHWSISGKPVFDGQGAFTGYRGTATDVTDLKRVEEALRTSEELFRSALENLQEGFALYDADDRLVTCNDEYRRLLGSVADLLVPGTTFEEINRTAIERGAVAPAIGRAEEHHRDRMEQHRNPTRPMVLELTDGTWCLINEAKMPDGGTVVTETDITELRQRQTESLEAERRYRRIFEATPVMLNIIDDHRRVLQVNKRWLENLGYERAAVLGRDVSDFLPKEQAIAFRAQGLPGTLPDDVIWDRPFKYERKNGERMDVLVTFVPERDAMTRERRWLVCSIDITERLKIERLKGEFVSVVSHELRSPLTSIMGALGLVRGRVAGELGDDTRGLIDIAYSNSERLGRLINDILEMEKIQTGELQFRNAELDLVPFVEEAIAANRIFGEENAVTFSYDPQAADAVVLADRDRLMQVLANLMSNAAKFSPRGSAVRIEVAAAGDDGYRVQITDRGPGIPTDFRDEVFEKFRQADASDTRSVGGSGLGLHISKIIIEGMGGRIGFEGAEGGGTAFYFVLPVAEAGFRDRVANEDE